MNRGQIRWWKNVGKFPFGQWSLILIESVDEIDSRTRTYLFFSVVLSPAQWLPLGVFLVFAGVRRGGGKVVCIPLTNRFRLGLLPLHSGPWAYWLVRVVTQSLQALVLSSLKWEWLQSWLDENVEHMAPNLPQCNCSVNRVNMWPRLDIEVQRHGVPKTPFLPVLKGVCQWAALGLVSVFSCLEFGVCAGTIMWAASLTLCLLIMRAKSQAHIFQMTVGWRS